MSASASALLLQQAGEAALQAMTHEKEGRDEAALAGMQRAAELILAVVRGGGCDAAQQQKLTARAREYLGKAEQLRARIDSRRAQQPASCRHEKTIEVAEGQTGCSYETVFHDWMQTATEARIRDPFIQSHHQCMNLLRLCELFIRDSRVKQIHVTTKACAEASARSDQVKWLGELAASLTDHGATLTVAYEETLHDRNVAFNNGWVVRLGRGLDYFKPPAGKFVIGSTNYHLRPCKQTTIDIFFDPAKKMQR